MKWRWLIVAFLPVVALAAWAWWQRPEPVEMARYVPAETLVYLEADSLPRALESFTDNATWRELAPQHGLNQDYGEIGWIGRTLARLNLGSTSTIVFGRAQIAVALVGVEAAQTGEALKIRPRYAVVIETKTSAARAGNFVENQIRDFARRQFGETSAEKLDRADAAWTIFRSPRDERKLFAAVAGSVVVVGNDERAVQSCLEARSGSRKSLAENQALAEMRERAAAADAFAFGLVTPEGVKNLAQIGAVLFAGQISDEPAAQSLVAQSLPPLFEKSVTAVGWSARRAASGIEDRYFVQMPRELVARLREPLTTSNQIRYSAAGLLPPDAHSITIYNLKNAGAAWRGSISALTTRLDVLSAAAFGQTANRLLEPYGAANANEFLNAAAGELTTARLSRNENETVAIVGVGDPVKLKLAVEPELKNPARAAIFAGDLLLLGEKDDAARCVAAASGENFGKTEAGRTFAETKLFADAPLVKATTGDEESARRFVRLFGERKNGNGETLKTPIRSVSEIALGTDGFERRAQSAFGLVGALAVSFAGE